MGILTTTLIFSKSYKNLQIGKSLVHHYTIHETTVIPYTVAYSFISLVIVVCPIQLNLVWCAQIRHIKFTTKD